MRTFLTLLAAIYSTCSYGIELGNFHDIKPVELRQASLYFQHFVDDGLDPYLYPEVHHEGLNVNIDIDFFRYVYWDSQIITATTTSQYRLVGLSTDFGVRLAPFINVFFHHQSMHLLDRPQDFPHFPCFDAVGFELFLFRRDAIPATLIK